jgi:hypothetical protein
MHAAARNKCGSSLENFDLWTLGSQSDCFQLPLNRVYFIPKNVQTKSSQAVIQGTASMNQKDKQKREILVQKVSKKKNEISN